MRTTIDIDAELLGRLRREADRQGIPLKHLLNAAIRRGLEVSTGRRRGRYRCPTFSMGNPRGAFDLDHALAVAADLEDQQVAGELERRK
jgi:hypothetical protein